MHQIFSVSASKIVGTVHQKFGASNFLGVGAEKLKSVHEFFFFKPVHQKFKSGFHNFQVGASNT